MKNSPLTCIFSPQAPHTPRVTSLMTVAVYPRFHWATGLKNTKTTHKSYSAKLFDHLVITFRKLALSLPLAALVACGGGSGGGTSAGSGSSATPISKPNTQYAKICNNGEQEGTGTCPDKPALGTLPTDWACTLDTVSGLIWEVKTPWQLNPAPRDLRNTKFLYSNYDSTLSPQLFVPGPGGVNGAYENPSQKELDAPTNALGFVKQVNSLTSAATLCGTSRWRIPTQTELESLLDLKVMSTPATSQTQAIARAAIDQDYFPNTNPGEPYASSTPTATDVLYKPLGHFTNNVSFKTFNKTIADQVQPYPRGGNYRAPLRLVYSEPPKLIAAGFTHTCAVKANQTVACWGMNYTGQLGNGANVASAKPVIVSNLIDAMSIAAGSEHSCAIKTGGGVVCWGKNSERQLGDGTTTARSIPVSANITDVTALSAGASHTCALKTNKTVACWGTGIQGQLGNGTYANGFGAVNVNISNVIAIAAGSNHTCALKGNGEVYCWGSGQLGELGIGSNVNSNVPVMVAITGTVKAIASHQHHTCAIKTVGDIVCWGLGTTGQLGNADNISSSIPVNVSLTGGASAIAPGDNQTCAVKTNGDVACWGRGQFGQLGSGSNNSSNVPIPFSIPNGISAITSGGWRSCAIKTSGDVVCWGWGTEGQLGNGVNAHSNVPVIVSGLNVL